MELPVYEECWGEKEMAEAKDIEYVLKHMTKHKPKHGPDQVDQMREGIGNVMRYLGQQAHPVTAGEISRNTGVTTARIAVLLKKMEEKGMITRSKDPGDSRKTLISLSSAGQEFHNTREAEFRSFIASIIDGVGMERLREFVEIQDQIAKIAMEHMEKRIRDQGRDEAFLDEGDMK